MGQTAHTQARDWLRADAQGKYDIVGFAECHVISSNIKVLRDSLSAEGWRLTATPARPTGRSQGIRLDDACEGGEWLLSRSNLDVTDCLMDFTSHTAIPGYGGANFYDGFVAITVHIKGGAITVVILYLYCSIELAAANLDRLSRVAAFVLSLKNPWGILADWNLKSEDLVKFGLPQQLGAQIVLAANLDYTCDAGEAGSTIDFALLSFAARDLLHKCEGDTTVPWGTHVGLKLTFDASVKSRQIRVWEAPRVFDRVSRPQHRSPYMSKSDIVKEAAAIDKAEAPVEAAPEAPRDGVQPACVTPDHVCAPQTGGPEVPECTVHDPSEGNEGQEPQLAGQGGLDDSDGSMFYPSDN